MSTKAKAKATETEVVLTHLAVWNITSTKSDDKTSFVRLMAIDENGDSLKKMDENGNLVDVAGYSFERVYTDALIADRGIVKGTRITVKGFKEVGKVKTSYINKKTKEVVELMYPTINCVWTVPAVSIDPPNRREVATEI